MKKLTRKYILSLYLEWCNDWLSLSKMADHYGFEVLTMDRIIHLGRRLNRMGYGRSVSPVLTGNSKERN